MTGSGASPELVPPVAGAVFGDRLALAEAFAGLLVDDGVLRGVIGPAEPPRIWTRHLLNCAVIGELCAGSLRVVDVGSGAGLPGLAIAIRHPDLRVDLVEPLQRRVDFLNAAVGALGLAEQVRVIRGRAPDGAVRGTVGDAPWVTARAVAPLDSLVRWCLPLLAADGRLALMKGASAADEISRHRAAIARAGGSEPRIVHCGVGVVDPAVSVVTLGRAAHRMRKGT